MNAGRRGKIFRCCWSNATVSSHCLLIKVYLLLSKIILELITRGREKCNFHSHGCIADLACCTVLNPASCQIKGG